LSLGSFGQKNTCNLYRNIFLLSNKVDASGLGHALKACVGEFDASRLEDHCFGCNPIAYCTNEVVWWEDHKIKAMEIARGLWEQTHPLSVPTPVPREGSGRTGS